MDTTFDFKQLFVLDMANNHQGSVEHGLSIVRAVSDVVGKHGVRAALKFQFRQLDHFIHPTHQEDSDVKMVQRFLSTRMERPQFQTLLDETRNRGLLTMCTPFDEQSVPVIVDMGFDVLKVASCSARDWPLLEEVANAGMPVVASTGGLGIDDIDSLVSFFQHRAVHFALMHCVSIYPTPDERMALHQLAVMKERYPGVTIGWSTHERPEDIVPVGIAVAKGAEMFERHVGVPTERIQLNAYSSTPEQLHAWLEAWRRAVALCGPEARPATSPEERDAIDSLRRGVFARRPIAAGTRLTRDMVYFAMPYQEGQLESGAWKEGIVVGEALEADAALDEKRLEIPPDPDALVIKKAVHEVKGMLNEARIELGPDFTIEYSHHYGMARFRETGAVLIECVNRDYCKKLIVQLPGQRHPSHYHATKEETFQVLHGVLQCEIDGHRRTLEPGDTALVMPGVFHSFWTDTGVIFEEISTRDTEGDSFYEDKRINKLARGERKTRVDHWGRFQIQSGPAEDAPVR
jgi:sialic acid synthase SpsE/mannose-6-phosphate isomerase-like protein (cupin superfamily)